jgi:hypothetical protein
MSWKLQKCSFWRFTRCFFEPAKSRFWIESTVSHTLNIGREIINGRRIIGWSWSLLCKKRRFQSTCTVSTTQGVETREWENPLAAPSPTVTIGDLRCARCMQSLDNGCPHRCSSVRLSGIGAINRWRRAGRRTAARTPLRILGCAEIDYNKNM